MNVKYWKFDSDREHKQLFHKKTFNLFDFQIFWIRAYLMEGYSTHAPCELILISTFFFPSVKALKSFWIIE